MIRSMNNHIPSLFQEDPHHRFDPIRLTDDEYARAIATLVVVCTDIGIVDRKTNTIYLAQRKARPAKGWWWYIGGRSRVGETEIQSAQRCFLRETGLSIDDARLSFITMQRHFFKDRQQPPTKTGCDSLCYVFALELTEQERQSIHLDKDEYEDGAFKAFSYTGSPHPELPAAINDFCKKVFK